ncbi:uncharacterized protein [Palaemon carinicauda]|uniref:uncharacterized protein isoform X2 n=1 Tax=Palaemon carinicauda TaxID=392227 RepID=UPI0035B64DBF
MKRTEDLVLKVNILSSVCYLCKQCCGLFYHRDALRKHLLKCKNEIDQFTSWPENAHSEVISEEEEDTDKVLAFDRKSTNSRSLQTHKATPSKRKPFACPVCKESFSNVDIFDEHRITHSGPFICRTCGKSFTRAWSLRRHLSSHFREAHITCKVCRRRFYRADNLRKHCKKHFNDIKYICGVCGEKHERKMCYKKSSSKLTMPKTSAKNFDNTIIQRKRPHKKGPSISSAAKYKLNNDLNSFGSPLISLEKASKSRNSSALEYESSEVSSSNETGNYMEPMYLNKSSLGSPSDGTLSERSSSLSEIVNFQSCWEDMSFEESYEGGITHSVDFMGEISSEVSSLFEVKFPEEFQERTLNVSSSFQSNLTKSNSSYTSLEYVTFEESSSLDEINNAHTLPELSLIEEPSFSTRTENPEPHLEGVSFKRSTTSNNFNNEALLGWELEEGAFSVRDHTSGNISDNPELEALLDVSARGIPVPGPFRNQSDLFSEGLLSPHKTVNACNSKERESEAIPSYPSNIANHQDSLECKERGIQSPLLDIDNATELIEMALLEDPFSIEDHNFWTLLEENFLEGPPMSDSNLYANILEEISLETSSSLCKITDSLIQDQRTHIDKLTLVPKKGD